MGAKPTNNTLKMFGYRGKVIVKYEVKDEGDVPCYVWMTQQSALLFSDIPFINHYQHKSANKMHCLLSV
jgi:hypothetical protein